MPGTAADGTRRVLGWTRDDFEAHDAQRRGEGWMLHAVDSYVEAGTLRFNGIWRRATEESDFQFGWLLADLNTLHDSHRAKGWRLHDIDTWVHGSTVRCNVLWRKPRVTRESALALSRKELDADNVRRGAEGWHVVAVDTTVVGSKDSWHLAWERGADDHDFVFGWSWDDFNDEVVRRRDDGWALWRVGSYQRSGVLSCNGVFRRGTSGHNWVLGYGWDDFLTLDDEYSAKGWALDTVDTFLGTNGAVQFNGTWTKHLPLAPLVGDCTYDGWMTDTATLPAAAVGFLSNGCTALLIDGEHILTAAHCLVNEGRPDNGYYTDLWFYPTFTTGTSAPRRHRVDRGVVGSHGATGGTYATSDWAIGHLATPATDLPAVEPGTTSTLYRNATVLHYTRDATLMQPPWRPAPYADEYGGLPDAAKDWKNTWWQDALRSTGVARRDSNVDYSTVEGASGKGGSSGAPHLVQDAPGVWRVVGVTHRGDCDIIDGPWAGRFIQAPRFASAVAVATSPTDGSRSGVYALDTARGQVVVRGRVGTGIDDRFGYWSVGAPVGKGVVGLAARARPGTGLPSLLALASGGAIMEWRAVPIPLVGIATWTFHPVVVPSTGVFVDIDATTFPEGAGIVAVQAGMDGAVMVAPPAGTGPGRGTSKGWGVLARAGPMTAWARVTALRHHGDGGSQVWALTTQGALRSWVRIGTAGWAEVAPQSTPALGADERLVDVDAAWDHRQRGLLVALSSRGRVFARTATSTNASGSWGSWMGLPDQVDPGVPINRSGVRLVSISASRWRETTGVGTGSDIVPVVVATDSWGNVVQTTQRSIAGGGVGWTDWMPFQGRRVAPWQAFQD